MVSVAYLNKYRAVYRVTRDATDFAWSIEGKTHERKLAELQGDGMSHYLSAFRFSCLSLSPSVSSLVSQRALCSFV